MNKKIVKIISVVLALLMLGTVFSTFLIAHAEPADNYPVETTAANVQTSEQNINVNTDVTNSLSVDETTTVAQIIEPDIITVNEATTNTIIEEKIESDGLIKVSLNVAVDAGKLTVIFTNIATKEKIKVELKYSDAYSGYVSIPAGTYGVRVKTENSYKIKLSEDNVVIKDTTVDVSPDVISVKDTGAGVSGFFRNNGLLLFLIAATCIFYIVYKRKNGQITND